MGGGLCQGETRFKPKALRRGEEGAVVSGTEASPCPSSGAAKFLPQQLRRSNSVDLPGETFLCQKRNFCIFGKAGRTIFYPFSLSPHPLYPGSLRPPFQPPAPPPHPVSSRWAGSRGARTPGSKRRQTFPRPPALTGPGAGAPPGLGAQPRLGAPQSRGPRLGADLRQARSSPRQRVG